MARSNHRRLGLPALLGWVLVLSAAALPWAGATPVAGRLLHIEPSSTRAGIARVHLELEGLRQNGETLEGTYQIRVPLLPWEDDTGQVVLHAPASLDHLGEGVTTMSGSAVSLTGQVNDVVARVLPGGVVRIRIDTPRRTLTFTSRLVAP